MATKKHCAAKYFSNPYFFFRFNTTFVVFLKFLFDLRLSGFASVNSGSGFRSRKADERALSLETDGRRRGKEASRTGNCPATFFTFTPSHMAADCMAFRRLARDGNPRPAHRWLTRGAASPRKWGKRRHRRETAPRHWGKRAARKGGSVTAG